jgi:hypothetical protein
MVHAEVAYRALEGRLIEKPIHPERLRNAIRGLGKAPTG